MDRKQRRQEMEARRAKRRGESSALGPSAVDLFQRALADHRAGRLQQAQAAYHQILTIDPSLPTLATT